MIAHFSEWFMRTLSTMIYILLNEEVATSRHNDFFYSTLYRDAHHWSEGTREWSITAKIEQHMFIH